MKKPDHILRDHRRQHPLTQADVAFLLNLEKASSISRFENGNRPLSIDVVLAYHLLFETQLGSLFADYRETIRSRIASRIPALIKLIDTDEVAGRSEARITYLKSTLTRLNHENS